jgi:hypothetical protein
VRTIGNNIYVGMEMLCPTTNELKLKVDKNSKRKTAEAADEALASLNMVSHKSTPSLASARARL